MTTSPPPPVDRQETHRLADAAPAMIWTCDPGGACTWFNRPWLEFVGRPLEKELGDGWADHVHPDDLDRALATFRDALAGRRPFEVEYRLRRHDGEFRWVIDRAAPLLDATGGFLGFIGCAFDVSDLKRAHDELHEFREVVALAMRGGRMGAWSRNTSDNRVWCSPELAEIFGIQPGEFEETYPGYFSFVHPEDRAAVVQKAETAIRDHREYVVEFRFRHASGEWRWMESRGRAVYGDDGQARMVYGVGIDVTEHKRVQQEHAYAQAIIDSSEDAIVSKTLDGVITSWNHGAERLFGYAAEEAVGKSIELIIPPDHMSEERDILARLRRGERMAHYETIRRRRDGVLLHVSLTISPVKDSLGRIVGASKIARDITDQRRIHFEREELLRREKEARARAEEASRLKDEFLATVSHELRTPLSAIVGWARLLREGRLEPEKIKYAAEVMERNASAQAQLINDLLDVSRIITGKLRLNVRRLMPASVIESALETLRPTIEAKDIRLHTMIESDAGPISGDSERLQQVIWNLVSNAVKFTPRGGRVQVRLEPVNSQIEVTVSDTGAGIPPEVLPHVFDRFRQADSSPARRHGGLGLGLAIVRHIVELHGGTVHASSGGEGKGATFTVSLPIMAVDARPFAEERVHPRVETRSTMAFEQAPRLDGIRVLVVDDEIDTRLMLREVLERCGAEVRDAGTARQAFEQIQEWRPDVFVSDIGMPGADGYELVRKVREWEVPMPTRIPAVALTAYARSEDRMKALLAGYQVHVAKPIDPVELVLVIASLMPRARPAG